MKKRIQEYCLVLVGTTMCAAAFGMFILPEGFLAGGVTGSARLICAVIGIPVSVLVLMINIALLLMGLIVMGKQFVSKSVFSSFYFPFALEMTQHIPLPLELLPVPVIAVIAGSVLGFGAALLTIVVSTSSMHITLNGIHIPAMKLLSTGRLKLV